MSDPGARHITLVVPGLFGPALADPRTHLESARLWCEALPTEVLQQFFARAMRTASAGPPATFAALVFDCFGVDRSGQDWPVAALTRSLDGGDADGRYWLRADPVHLRVDRGELAMLDLAALGVSAGEAESLTREINAERDDQSALLQPLATERWYLSPDTAPDLITEAPWDVAGSGIGDYLPRGTDAARWQAWVNDAQMILHASSVNRAREARGEPAINSVWLWGGGYLPPVPAARWIGVCADHTLALALAHRAGLDADADVGSADRWLDRHDRPGEHLVVLSEAIAAVRRADVDDWMRFVARFQEDWLAPLLRALRAGRVQSLRLRTAGNREFLLTRRAARRWWRRSRDFARVMVENA